jgi:hypothetical protein
MASALEEKAREKALGAEDVGVGDAIAVPQTQDVSDRET